MKKFAVRSLVCILLAAAMLAEPAVAGAASFSSSKRTLLAVASGRRVLSQNNVVIDVSNSSSGYIMVKYTGSSADLIKVMVTCPNGLGYLYTLTNKNGYNTFPLSEGNGIYTVKVYKHTTGSRYLNISSLNVSVRLSNAFAPFLRPNQYVNYNKSTKVVKKAKSLSKGCKTELQVVTKVYEYVIKNFKYDRNEARTVRGGYLPNLNSIYSKKKGICFDYAAVMTAMLRSRGIPCKLVIGYAGSAYHAWINVYTKKSGWITNAIYFNGKKWKLMDPTFASTGNSSKKVLKYIGDGAHYRSKYVY